MDRAFVADEYFTAAQQSRLKELMDKWRFARDAGLTLNSDELAELHALVDAELVASGKRAAALTSTESHRAALPAG